MKIISITGSGRTGSTLISLLLSQGSDVFNLGQFRHLAAAYHKNPPCSCGQTLRDCAVYSQVFADPGVAAYIQDEPGLDRRLRSFFKDAKKAKDWSDPSTLASLRASHADMLAEITTLLDVISRVTGNTCFVDSSKIPEMALVFELAKPGALYSLNLVRDPRAVAVSWHKKSPRLLRTARHIRDYAARQRRLAAWGATLGARFHVMRYEDFAADPRPELAKAAHWAGLTLPEVFHGSHSGTLNWDRQHLFPPANEAVLAKRAVNLEVAESVSWKDDKHRRLHNLTRLLAPQETRSY
ncbi:MAG: sulfotransferase [Pseudomonadota bacterium]